MPIKKILVSVRGTESSSSTLDTGLIVAHDLGARAEVLHVKSDPLDAVPAFADGVTGRMADQLVSISDKDVNERAMAASFPGPASQSQWLPVHLAVYPGVFSLVYHPGTGRSVPCIPRMESDCPTGVRRPQEH